jgi:hypothetical protein
MDLSLALLILSTGTLLSVGMLAAGWDNNAAESTQKLRARLILLSPAWPIVLVGGIILLSAVGLTKVWRTAFPPKPVPERKPFLPDPSDQPLENQPSVGAYR